MPAYFLLDEAPLRVRAGGAWLQGDEPLHPRVATLFAQHVTLDDDGAYVLRIGYDQASLQVEDTPFIVRSAQPEYVNDALVSVTLRLSDGATELLDPHTLAQTADHVLYCGLRRGGYAVPARFAAAHYHALSQHIHADAEDQGYALHLGGRSYPIVRAAGVPQPKRLP